MTNSLLAVAIHIMITIESGGDVTAIGDNGRSIGCLQIQAAVVQDVNKFLGKNKYTNTDRFDPRKSIEIAQVYLSHYCTKKRLGRAVVLEDYFRTWNGGPTWWKIKDAKKRSIMRAYCESGRNLRDLYYSTRICQDTRLRSKTG